MLQYQIAVNAMAMEDIYLNQSRGLIMNWKLLSEEKPKLNMDLNVTLKPLNSVMSAYHCNGEFFTYFNNHIVTDRVVAWMPMPEPYKTESE